MATLAGSTIASTYTYLLKMDGTSGLTSSLVAVQDGDATDSALSISTTSASIGHTVTTAASTPKALFIDANTSGDAAQNATGLHIDFDRTVASASTYAHNDIGIDLDVNSASLGTSSVIGMDIDVVGATSGTHTATGLTVTVGSSDTNYAALFNGGNVGIGTSSPDAQLEVETDGADQEVRLSCHSDTEAHTSTLTFLKSDNTAASPGTIDSGSVIGQIIYYGYDNDGYDTGAKIVVAADANWSVSERGTKMSFYTRDANESVSENLVIAADGNVGIGDSSPDAPLVISGGTSMTGGWGRTLTLEHNFPVLALRSENATDAWGGIGYDNSTGMKFFVNSSSVDIPTDGTLGLTILDSGDVGIGDDSPDAHLDVQNDAVSTTADFQGIWSNHTKTGGATNASDDVFGVRNEMTVNQTDGFFRDFYGLYSSAFAAQTSDGESVGLYGAWLSARMDGSDVDVTNCYGNYVNVDFNGGTVDTSVYGEFIKVDIESGGTISDNVVALAINLDSDTDPTGSVYVQTIDTFNNTDFLYNAWDSTNGTVVKWTPAGEGYWDGVADNGNADYAEYFESTDGKVIDIGNTVVLEDGKIRQSEDGETPIGVIRPHEAVAMVGNSAWSKWQEQLLTDDYGAKIMEDYTLTKWSEEITEEEYLARGKDETGGVEGGRVKDEKVKGSKAIPAKDAVTRHKTVDEEVEEEVTTTELVDGKYVQKTKTVTKTVGVCQYEEVDLYDEDGDVIGKHQVPIMETVEEAVAAVDAVADTYFREHKYHSDRIPEGVTPPDNAEVIEIVRQRQKLNPDFDESLEYIPREKRDEWHIVGLLGQIPITKGQPVASTWIKMKDVSDTIEMYFVK